MNFESAVRIYLASCIEKAVAIAMQPSRALSRYSRGVWYLNNVNGPIARVGRQNERVF